MQRAASLGMVAMLAASVAITACDSASERSSEVVVAPMGRWRQAHVEVAYGPRFSKNGRSHPPHVRHSLFLDWDQPYNSAQVILLSETTDTLTPERFAELRETQYALRFAPDAHALAVSTDGERTWTIFDLTILTGPTEQPFWCAHRSFTSLEPWPSSDALALEILAAADPSSPAAAVHRASSAIEWPSSRAGASSIAWLIEIEGATRYACAHRDDPTLREALVQAFLRLGSQAGYAQSCVPEMARTDPALQQRLVRAVQASPPIGAPP